LTYLGFAKEFAAIANPLPNDNIMILAERGPMLRMAETSPLYQIMPNGGNYYLHKFIFHLLLKPSEKRIETDRGKRSKVVIDR
jgi:hypothetical protein